MILFIILRAPYLFCRLYNNILPAGQLVHGSNYHFFKHGIEPKWEDAANQNGGKWIVNIPQKMKDKLDMYWLYTVRFVV